MDEELSLAYTDKKGVAQYVVFPPGFTDDQLENAPLWVHFFLALVGTQ